jgi:basic amino acid/polyamine antiporter, APA family
MEQGSLKREISIFHGIMLIIGTVIGASAFILIGPLAGQTGPGLWMAYALGAIPAIFVAVVFAQLGSAFPVTGATYMAISRLLSPAVSLMTVWSAILGIFAFAMPLMAFGFALYVDKLFPLGGDMMLLLVAALTIVFFTILNIFEIKWMMWAQSILTLIMIAVLMVFGFGGSFAANPALQTPIFPLGFSAVLAAIIPAYVMYTGLNGMTEIGGEVKNPSRNIPIILAVSLVLLVVLYVAITYALTGLISWQELGKIKGATAVATAAGLFMPAGFALVFASVGALFASATTINGSIAFLSRDLLALGKDKVLPDALGKVSRRFHTPVPAVFTLGIVSILGLAMAVVFGENFITYCATAGSYAFMMLSMFGCIAVFQMREKMPERYEKARFKIKGFWFSFFTIGGAIVFGGLILWGFISGYLADPKTGWQPALALIILVVTGLLYYYLRKWQLAKRGINIEDKLKKVEEY